MELARKIFEAESLMQNICKVTKSKLSLLKLKVLYFIDEYKTLSPRIIVSKLGIKRPNLANLSRQLLEEGYIEESRTKSDKRCKVYSLTEKGKNELEGILNNISLAFRKEEVTSEIEESLKILTEFLNKKV